MVFLSLRNHCFYTLQSLDHHNHYDELYITLFFLLLHHCHCLGGLDQCCVYNCCLRHQGQWFTVAAGVCKAYVCRWGVGRGVSNHPPPPTTILHTHTQTYGQCSVMYQQHHVCERYGIVELAVRGPIYSMYCTVRRGGRLVDF